MRSPLGGRLGGGSGRLSADAGDQHRRDRRGRRAADRADGEHVGEVAAGWVCRDEDGPGDAGTPAQLITATLLAAFTPPAESRLPRD
jgi:hypothetical protein